MDHFKRGRRLEQDLNGRAERLTDSQQQRRPKPFAASKNTPADRLVNFFRSSGG